MGKTIKKNQTQRRNYGVSGGRYTVKGKTFDLPNASSDTIAEDMAQSGYRTGAQARWNGGLYRLSIDYFGDATLKRVDL